MNFTIKYCYQFIKVKIICISEKKNIFCKDREHKSYESFSGKKDILLFNIAIL